MQAHSRIGLILFGLYVILYAGFVFMNAFAPNTMEWMPLPGINLAIVYGFLLIFVAVVMALIYGAFCKSSEDEETTQEVDP
jgi:uncharacterized membrane protein (DUF485 family)